MNKNNKVLKEEVAHIMNSYLKMDEDNEVEGIYCSIASSEDFNIYYLVENYRSFSSHLVCSQDVENSIQSEASYCFYGEQLASPERNAPRPMQEHCIGEQSDRMIIPDQIALWATEEIIRAKSLNKLLMILKPVVPALPRDARTLQKTPNYVPKITIPGGYYVHYGIKDSLTDFMHCTSSNVTLRVLELNFNIDGLPVSKR